MGAKKKYGQNFLSNKIFLNKIAEHIRDGLDSGPLLEIGPGKGALTRYLVQMGVPLTVVEIDEDLCPALLEEFGSVDGFSLIQKDILKYSIEEDTRFVVVGNVPYYISFDIIEFIVSNRHKVKKAYFTFQKEFARKLCSAPGTKEYGFLSCFTQMFFDCKLKLKIPASAFNPKPKIDSAFVEIKLKDNDLLNKCDLKSLKSFLRAIFSKRRKKMSNVLKSRYPDISLENYAKMGINVDLRPENITIEQFASLFNYFS